MTRNYTLAERPAATKLDQVLPVPNATTPYWRTQLHYLDEYRSTPGLPSDCDIAIIGAGMSGVSTAYHLLKLYEAGGNTKPSITLIEARQVCSGATGRNGGHAKVKTSSLLRRKAKQGIDAANELSAFNNNLISQLKGVVEQEKLDCEFEIRRSFDVFLDETEAKEVETAFLESVANGERWTKDVDLVEKKFAEQITSIKGVKTAFSVPACSMWPYKFVTQLLERIIDDVNLQTNTPVTECFYQRDVGRHILTTPRGKMDAKKVVFASNAYTGGISPVYKDKIVPYKGTNSHLKPRAPISPHLANTYNLEYGTHADYLNPRPDGGITVGGAKVQFAHDRSTWFNNFDDSQLLPNVHSYFAGLMQRHFKGWKNSGSSLDHLWTGIMGLTADEWPHVGEVPGPIILGKTKDGRVTREKANPGQYVLAGFNGGGMSMIHSCAMGMAKMIMTGCGFEETGLPKMFETTEERLKIEIEGVTKG